MAAPSAIHSDKAGNKTDQTRNPEKTPCAMQPSEAGKETEGRDKNRESQMRRENEKATPSQINTTMKRANSPLPNSSHTTAILSEKAR
ncbi:hypothetical protein VTJ04DRAFT_5335 [Mycothermus thermophilus]|uniref:uncharacterized protein n=1 Tax=Humicola insolens TaxID=85995 RepID=UPI0037434B61